MINDDKLPGNEKRSLNNQQLQAVKYGSGPLLVIAGAGTGKTTVITERIKYLIFKNLAKPSEILALTFTEKAALEMEERVDKIMPYGYIQMWISTFHSFCDRILRDEALQIGLDSHYVLMTKAETILFLKKRLFKFSLDYFRPAGNPNKFLNGLLVHFDSLRNEDILPKDYHHWVKVQSGDIKKDLELANAYEKYEELKIKEGVMDFADLINNTLKLFRTRKNILKKYRQKFKYILIDEFQDTNISQNELIKLLGFPRREPNLTVVGDDSQSIYKFRGAAVSNILSFMDDYPNAKKITLIKNYRSTQTILDSAYKLIKHNDPDTLENKLGIDKNLISTRKAKGVKIKCFAADRVENEADIVASEVKRLVLKKRPGLPARPGLYKWSDIAILVRANNHADPFVRAFLRLGIPFQFLGPGRLLRKEEVKDLIAYLKVLYNFEDNVAFFRVLSLSIFKLSARDIAAIRNYARKLNFSLFEASEKASELRISDKTKEKIKKIVNMLHKHFRLISKDSAGQILYYFLEDTGMLKSLTEIQSVKQEERVNNIAKFFSKLKTFEAENEDSSVEAVVDWLNLKMEIGESPLASDIDWTQENKVNILTIHSAKGLEFQVVFLVNLVNERFPTRRRRDQIPLPDNLLKEILPEGDFHEQEERRLFYVGMTRAKDLLYFTSAKFYGEAKRMKKISPFIQEALGKEFTSHQSLITNHQSPILDFKPAKKPQSPITNHQSPITINYLSYSQLDTFNRCPLQYKYRYILKIPAPISSAASFGISIHNSLKDFYKLVIENRKTHSAGSGQASKKDILEIFKKNWIKEGYSSKAHEKKMYARGKKFSSEFFDRGYKTTDKSIALEESFIIKISSGLKLGGRFDRVDELKANGIEIIDYKTGKVPVQKEVDKSLQMTFYAIAAVDRGIYNKDPKDVLLSFYFFETQEKVSTRRTWDDLEKARKEIIEKAKEMEKSDFSPKPSMLCDFCDYKLLCPAWQ